MKDIYPQLADPPVQYRPFPFWSWNADLKVEELVRQVGLMHDVGLGGLIMHARGGLETEYLGKEWFQCINAVVDACHQYGMLAWAYDENGWPSGFANGAVNGLGETCQQKYLRCGEVSVEEYAKLTRVLACYDLQGKRLDGDALPKRFLCCWYELNPFYVDLCNPKVPQEFIRLVYERYRQEIPAAKHAWLQGFFTDEPQMSRNGIPYSPEAMAIYDQKWQEKSLDFFPQLFLEVGNWKRFRRRFWKTIGECFADNFTRALGDWCGRHDWKLTGHMVLEETYRAQQNPNPSGVMTHYRHFQIPGMDWLGRSIRTRTTATQCWSVCAQTGKKQMLTESFAGCGWNVSLGELRYLLNAQMIHGANLLCDHLEGYTLRGLRKRDYPASLYFHQPWWPSFRYFTDWAGRIGMLLASGSDTTQVLLLHGISSSHLYLEELTSEAERKYGKEDAGRHELADRYSDAFDRMGEALDVRGVGVHFGDEEMMEKLGRADKNGFTIGRMTYRAVVVPQLANLSAVQMEQLRTLAGCGYPIYGVRDTIGKQFHIDGEVADWGELASRIRWFDSEEEAAAAVAEQFAAVSIQPQKAENFGSILHTERAFELLNGRPAVFHYFWNSDKTRKLTARIRVPGRSAELFDAETGTAAPCAVKTTPAGVEWEAVFPAGGELVYFVYDTAAAPAENQPEPGRNVSVPAAFRLDDATPNLLTLDRCDCFAEGKLFLANEYVLTVQDRLLDLGHDVPVRLRFTFRTAADFTPSTLKLLVERPNLWQLRVNGKICPSADAGFLFDPAFRQIDIAPLVKAGDNVIELEGTFHQSEVTRENFRKAHFFESELNKLTLDTEIEAIYLAGDFGVDCNGTFTPAADQDEVRFHGDFTLNRSPETVRLDAVEQSGFPFFAGTLTLSAPIQAKAGEPLHLVFAKQLSSVCEISFNGKPVKTLLWLEPEADIPGQWVKEGANTLTLKLTSSLRNMLGPHHLADPAPFCLGPRTFFKDPGVFARTNVRWTDDWNFARFGMA